MCVASSPLCSVTSSMRTSPLPLRVDELVVGLEDAVDVTLGADRAVVEEQPTLAEPLDGSEVVRDEADRLALRAELVELRVALALEILITNGEDLVDEQHVRIDEGRDREREARVHAGRIRLHCGVEEVAELGERDDVGQHALGLLAREAEQ